MIADVQENVTTELNRMLDFMAEELELDIVPSEMLTVSMIPPVVLILQLIEMTAGSASNIIGVFQNLQLPIDPLSFLKKYIPFINWVEFEAKAAKYSLEKAVEFEMKSKSDAALQTQIQNSMQQPGM